jgi:hypothetical protein
LYTVIEFSSQAKKVDVSRSRMQQNVKTAASQFSFFEPRTRGNHMLVLRTLFSPVFMRVRALHQNYRRDLPQLGFNRLQLKESLHRRNADQKKYLNCVSRMPTSATNNRLKRVSRPSQI